jgi:hypothetical protein
MTVRARWIAFLSLLVVWVGIGVWVLTQSPEPQRVPLTFVSGQKAKREASPGKSVSNLKIQLELLAANRQRTEKSFGKPKNIFAPVFPGQGGGPGQDFAGQAGPPTAQPPLPPPSPQELARQAGVQELSQYRYLGYLTRGGKDQAFLSRGKDLHIVTTGETIEQRVLVNAITPAGVTLQETASQVEQTVMPIP